MQTKKLYEADSYKKEFDAVVLGCEPTDGGFAVILDRTVFFCEGGGQYGDGGILASADVTARVSETVPHGGEIVHLCDRPFAVGDTVHGTIDFDTRYRNMQNHSGEHIVSGIIHALYGFDNVGFHLGRDYVSVDINGVLDADALRLVEDKANRAIYENVPITVFFPNEEALKTLFYRSKKELSHGVRLVEVEGYDLCACCAPHVRRTGEIGLIKILDPIHYKGGIRFYLQCGVSALQDYRAKNERLLAVSHILSAKQENIAGAVERMKKELAETRQTVFALRRALIEEELSSLTHTEKPLLFFETILDANALRNLVNEALPYTSALAGAFLGDEENGYFYLLSSENVKLRTVSDAMRERFGAKGGGSDRMIQGNVRASRAELTAWIDQLASEAGGKETI